MFWLLGLALAGEAQVDTTCAALVERLQEAAPALRRGRVEVVACARRPGELAILVVRPARGVVGDPLDLVAGTAEARQKLLRAAWPAERVVLAADRGDPVALVRDALAPVEPDEIVLRPGGLSVDVVVPAEVESSDQLRLAALATGLSLRVFNPGSWTMARIQARDALLEQLPVSEDDVDRLVAAGVLAADDVAAMPAEALARVVGGDAARAQALADAAAWYAEIESSPSGRRRGW